MEDQSHSEDCSIYVISTAGGRVKIGISVDPGRRLAAIQTSSPFRVALEFQAECKDAKRLEREVHLDLVKHRLNGEWFEISVPDAVDAILSTASRIGMNLTQPDQQATVAPAPYLTSIRKRLRLTQSEMAALMGLKPRAYFSLEQNPDSVSIRHRMLAEHAALSLAVERGDSSLATDNLAEAAVKFAELDRD